MSKAQAAVARHVRRFVAESVCALVVWQAAALAGRRRPPGGCGVPGTAGGRPRVAGVRGRRGARSSRHHRVRASRRRVGARVRPDARPATEGRRPFGRRLDVGDSRRPRGGTARPRAGGRGRNRARSSGDAGGQSAGRAPRPRSVPCEGGAVTGSARYDRQYDGVRITSTVTISRRPVHMRNTMNSFDPAENGR